jgi:hypothetical protein
VLFRPGTLTRTYLQGARVRDTGPLQVYLLLMITDRLEPPIGIVHDVAAVGVAGLVLCFQLVLTAWVLSVASLGFITVRGVA